MYQLCGTRTSADGKICARELEGAQALWYQFHIDCHGDQYSDVYGDPGRYDLDADSEPYYSGSGHCRYIILGFAVRRTEQFEVYGSGEPSGYVDAGSDDEGAG